MPTKNEDYRLKQWTVEEVVKKMDGKQIFLSYGWDDREYVKDIFQPMLEKAGFNIYNPLVNRPSRYHTDDDEKGALERETYGITAKTIIEGILIDISDCSALIAYVREEPRFGVAFEIYHAVKNNKIPVWVIFEKPDDILNFHPWLIYFMDGAIRL